MTNKQDIVEFGRNIRMSIYDMGIHIKVSNFEKSTRFYESLGFEKVFEYGPHKKVKEDYSGMVYEHGNCKLELANGHRAVKPSVFKERIRSSKISLMVHVDKLSSILRFCKESNIDISVGPRHYYWGTLEMVVKDPDGVVLVFIAPYSKKEAKKVNADETWASKAN